MNFRHTYFIYNENEVTIKTMSYAGHLYQYTVNCYQQRTGSVSFFPASCREMVDPDQGHDSELV